MAGAHSSSSANAGRATAGAARGSAAAVSSVCGAVASADSAVSPASAGAGSAAGAGASGAASAAGVSASFEPPAGSPPAAAASLSVAAADSAAASPVASDGCFLRLTSSASARATSSWRTLSALQRCQPSSSPAETSAACTRASSASSIRRPWVLSDWRSALVALCMFLVWPLATACSSSMVPASTAFWAAARCSGSTLGLAGFSGSATGSPRAARSSSAQTGTGGSGAAASCAAARVCASAAVKASHTAASWVCAASSCGG